MYLLRKGRNYTAYSRDSLCAWNYHPQRPPGLPGMVFLTLGPWPESICQDQSCATLDRYSSIPDHERAGLNSRRRSGGQG